MKRTYTPAEVETIQCVTAQCYDRAYDYYEDFFETLDTLRDWAVAFEDWWKALGKDEQEEKDYLNTVEEYCEAKLNELKKD